MSLKERLLYKRKITSTGCWEWTGHRSAKGYGRIAIGEGRVDKTHRVAWKIFRGIIPKGKFVLHNCHNPPCFNPAHLKIGTNSDNRLDAWKHGSLGVSFHQTQDIPRFCKHCAKPFTKRATLKRWIVLRFCSRACWCRYMNERKDYGKSHRGV